MQQGIHPSLFIFTSIMFGHHFVNVVDISYDRPHHPPVDSCALSDTEIINDISAVISQTVVYCKIIVSTMKFTTHKCKFALLLNILKIQYTFGTKKQVLYITNKLTKQLSFISRHIIRNLKLARK